jgi:hypothetical protein
VAHPGAADPLPPGRLHPFDLRVEHVQEGGEVSPREGGICLSDKRNIGVQWSCHPRS